MYHRTTSFIFSCLKMKKTLIATAILCICLTTLFTFSHVTNVYANDHEGPKNVFTEDLEKVINFSYIAAEATRIIGLRITIIFMILGMILLNFAAGLRHPGYGRWGRSSLIMSVLTFFIILIVPPLLYTFF